MGRIVAPFGIRGWVKIHSFTAPPERLLSYRDWQLSRDGLEWINAVVVDRQPHGATVVACFEGCTDRTAAQLFTGMEIGVPRAELPAAPAGEYYWADLVGMEVRNLQSERLGTVVRMMETGANDVLVVCGDRERLIPFVTPVVVDVNAEQRDIVVDWGRDY